MEELSLMVCVEHPGWTLYFEALVEAADLSTWMEILKICKARASPNQAYSDEKNQNK